MSVDPKAAAVPAKPPTSPVPAGAKDVKAPEKEEEPKFRVLKCCTSRHYLAGEVHPRSAFVPGHCEFVGDENMTAKQKREEATEAAIKRLTELGAITGA